MSDTLTVVKLDMLAAAVAKAREPHEEFYDALVAIDDAKQALFEDALPLIEMARNYLFEMKHQSEVEKVNERLQAWNDKANEKLEQETRHKQFISDTSDQFLAALKEEARLKYIEDEHLAPAYKIVGGITFRVSRTSFGKYEVERAATLDV